MPKPKKILTVGVFDLLHVGHVRLLNRASLYGNHLTVAVHDDKEQVKNIRFHHSLDKRMQSVKLLPMVHRVIRYERVDLLLPVVDFDVFIRGEDQNHHYFAEALSWCKTHGKQVITLPRTPGISSTILRSRLESSHRTF